MLYYVYSEDNTIQQLASKLYHQLHKAREQKQGR